MLLTKTACSIKMFRYKVFSRPDFLVFGLNTQIYSDTFHALFIFSEDSDVSFTKVSILLYFSLRKLFGSVSIKALVIIVLLFSVSTASNPRIEY